MFLRATEVKFGLVCRELDPRDRHVLVARSGAKPEGWRGRGANKQVSSI